LECAMATLYQMWRLDRQGAECGRDDDAVA
jgi:hypothetical protein